MEPAQLIQLRQRAALATALFALLVYLVCLWWWETKSWERYVVEKEAPAWIIYGTAWESAEQLAEHQRLQAEAKRRDHRAIGKQMDLFSIQQTAGGGLVFWHPKGSTMRNLMEEYWKKAHLGGGYELLNTPHMASIDLWKTRYPRGGSTHDWPL